MPRRRRRVTVVVDPQRLRAALAMRGGLATDLVRSAGLSAPTIGAALAGRPIAARSLKFIAQALSREPEVGLIASLIDRRESNRDHDIGV